MDTQQAANLLGALALALSDDMQAAVRQQTGLSPTACAVLTTLGPYPGQTIGAVAQVLGVTHSVAVRVVDDLVRRGFVARAPGEDRRQVKLRLTEAGTAVRDTIMAARNTVLNDALAVLNPEDWEPLEAMVSAMLIKLTASRAKADHLCRLCDEYVCTRDTCPVEMEAVRKTAASGALGQHYSPQGSP
jgi:MarR family transcriptional regulator, negative regulator of the multidrug operon emrRAB